MSSDFDVFLAQNHQDKEQVQLLNQLLRERGLKPWLDVEQIPPGRWFQDIIQEVIPTVKSALIIIGTSGIGRWQSLELRAFITRCIESDIPVIPVLLPDVDEIPTDLIFLRELNWISFTNKIDDRNLLDSLVWGITGHKPT